MHEDETKVLRGINYLVINLGYFIFWFLIGMLSEILRTSVLLGWFAFLAFVGLALLLDRRGLSISNWLRRKHGRGILVYSNSPRWKAYIESRWLPAAGDHLAAINISENQHWRPSLSGLTLEAHLFSRKRPLLPVALVFPDGRPPEFIEFNGAFLDRNAGNDEQIYIKEQHLARALGVSLPG